MDALSNFYLQQQEPVKSCLLALRTIIFSQSSDITHVMKYGMPFFCYKGKMFCYLWTHKKYKQPYIGIVEGNRIDHPALIMEKRSRMKIMLLQADKDLPVNTINSILQRALNVFRKGMVRIK